MDTLVLLFVIIAVISNLTKNRKKKAEKKNTWRPGGQQAQPRQAQPRAGPASPSCRPADHHGGGHLPLGHPRAAQVHCQTCEAGRQAYPPRRGPKRRRQPGRTLYRGPIHPGQHGSPVPPKAWERRRVLLPQKGSAWAAAWAGPGPSPRPTGVAGMWSSPLPRAITSIRKAA